LLAGVGTVCNIDVLQLVSHGFAGCPDNVYNFFVQFPAERRIAVTEINVSDLRQHLPAYLRRVQAGEELAITAHGRVIARLVPDQDPRVAAKERLAKLRATAMVGDVVSPVAEDWEATRDHP
jgi:prevent-host-death family protein